MDVSGKNSTLFPKPALGSESTKVYYRYPKWISSFGNILSDVFNLDTEEAVANRKVETTAKIDLAHCSSPFESSTQSIWYTVNVGDDFGGMSPMVSSSSDINNGNPHVFTTELSGTEVTVHWYVVPQVSGGSINSPWGIRRIKAYFVNKHSNESFTPSTSIASFDVKYNPVVLNKLCVYPVNDQQRKYSNADCYICCNLAAMLYTPGKQAPVTFNGFVSLPIGGHQYTNDYYTDNTITENTAAHAYIYLRYVAYALRGWGSTGAWGNYDSPLNSGYNGIYWYDAMVDEAIRIGAGQLTDCYFYYGGSHESTLRSDSYPGTTDQERATMKTYLPVQIGDPRTVRAVKY